jgi:hypothetical protein
MRRLLVVLVLVSFCRAGYSQVNQKTVSEFGLGLSLLAAFTDIGGAVGGSGHGVTEYFQALKRPGIVGFYKYNINPRYSIKLNGTVGLLAGSDEGSRNDIRKYSFSSIIVDVSAIGVYYIIPDRQPFFYKSQLSKSRSWGRNIYPSLYVQAGVGACFYVPKPNEKLEKATLMGYSGGKTMTPVFPIGFGSSLPVAKDLRVFIEANYVLTLTDYLEGYSNTKYSKSNDAYTSINMGLIYQIGNQKTSWRKSRLYRR